MNKQINKLIEIIDLKNIIKPTHNKVVGIVGVLSILLGSIANIKQYGYSIGALFLLASILALYVLMSEISCVLTGNCHLTALFNSLISIIIFGSIVYYYSDVLLGKTDLPKLTEQPIIKVDRAVIPISGAIGAEVKKLEDGRKLEKVE
jgi:hypothetical protein